MPFIKEQKPITSIQFSSGAAKTFAIFSLQLRKLRNNWSALADVQSSVRKLLNTDAAKSTIASGANNCGEIALVALLRSVVVSPFGSVDSSPQQNAVVVDAAKRVLELDIRNRIDANAYKHEKLKISLLAVRISDDAVLFDGLLMCGADLCASEDFGDTPFLVAAWSHCVRRLGAREESSVDCTERVRAAQRVRRERRQSEFLAVSLQRVFERDAEEWRTVDVARRTVDTSVIHRVTLR